MWKVLSVGVPGMDIARVELEDAEAEIACEHRVLSLNLRASTSKSLLGHFSDVRGLLASQNSLLPSGRVFGIKWLRKLDKDEPAFAAVRRILSHDGLAGGSGASEEIEDNVIVSMD